MARRLAQLAGGVAALPLGVLVAAATITPITWSGAFYLLGSVLAAAGGLTAPWRVQRYRGLARAGILIITGVAVTRLLGLGASPSLRLMTLPQQGEARWLNRLLAEQDVALFGERVLLMSRTFLTPREAEGLIPALHTAYVGMQATDGATFSPFLSTYLGREQPTSFDVIVAEPRGKQPPTVAVVFLHGFTGNFTVQCWLVAQAAREVDALTVCPSVGWRGDWWTDEGAATLNTTLDYLQQRGVERVYLAGLSNGAVGACRLASRITPPLAGLILISGADAGARSTDLPLLLVQGTHDERMPAALARQLARQAGERATYHELDGDHFVLAKRHAEARTIIGNWLRQQERLSV